MQKQGTTKRRKGAVIFLNVSAETRALAEALAERDQRTLTNWFEAIVKREAQAQGIAAKRGK